MIRRSEDQEGLMRKQAFVKDFTTLLSIDTTLVASSNQLRQLEQKLYQEMDELENTLTKTRKRKRLEDKDCLKISIFIRGDITQRVYSIWETQLPKCLTNYRLEINNTALAEADIIIVSPAINKQSFITWVGSIEISDTTYIVSSQWAINTIKTNSFAPVDSYLLPSFRASLTTPVITLSDNNEDPILLQANDEPNNNTKSNHDETLTKLRKDTGQFYHPGYACIKTGEIKSVNANKYITDILENLQGIYDLCGDEWRSQGYKKAVAALKQLPRVTNLDQLHGIKGIGASIREKIKEILETGDLRKLKYFQDDTKIKSMMELSKIWGVGAKTAGNFIKQGYHSIVDLRTERGLALLTKQQQIGLKYYEELLVKIPRQEMDAMHEIVKAHCNILVPNYNSVICGSYRRGKPQSGDIDILIAPKAIEMQIETHDILAKLIDLLSDSGFLTDHLALPYHSSATFLKSSATLQKKAGKGGKVKEVSWDDSQENSSEDITRASYMGVCLLPNQPKAIHRRIDIKIYPFELLPFAMLYFTGSDHFNRSMRLYAKKRGFSLSDKGLTYQEKVRYHPNIPYKIGEFIPCKTEEEIFEKLGLPYKAPHERNVFDIDHQFTEQMEEHEFDEVDKLPFQLNEDSDDD